MNWSQGIDITEKFVSRQRFKRHDVWKTPILSSEGGANVLQLVSAGDGIDAAPATVNDGYVVSGNSVWASAGVDQRSTVLLGHPQCEQLQQSEEHQPDTRREQVVRCCR